MKDLARIVAQTLQPLERVRLLVACGERPELTPAERARAELAFEDQKFVDEYAPGTDAHEAAAVAERFVSWTAEWMRALMDLTPEIEAIVDAIAERVDACIAEIERQKFGGRKAERLPFNLRGLYDPEHEFACPWDFTLAINDGPYCIEAGAVGLHANTDIWWTPEKPVIVMRSMWLLKRFGARLASNYTVLDYDWELNYVASSWGPTTWTDRLQREPPSPAIRTLVVRALRRILV